MSAPSLAPPTQRVLDTAVGKGGERERASERERERKRTELITTEVEYRGMLSILCEHQDSIEKDAANLCSAVIRATLLGSFRIWCSRNCKLDPDPIACVH